MYNAVYCAIRCVIVSDVQCCPLCSQMCDHMLLMYNAVYCAIRCVITCKWYTILFIALSDVCVSAVQSVPPENCGKKWWDYAVQNILCRNYAAISAFMRCLCGELCGIAEPDKQRRHVKGKLPAKQNQLDQESISKLGVLRSTSDSTKVLG